MIEKLTFEQALCAFGPEAMRDAKCVLAGLGIETWSQLMRVHQSAVSLSDAGTAVGRQVVLVIRDSALEWSHEGTANAILAHQHRASLEALDLSKRK